MRFEVALDPRARRAARIVPAGEPVAVPDMADAPLADAPLDAALGAARRGEDAGFLPLSRELQPRLLRSLRIRTTDTAEDVAAETWLHVVKDLASFRGGADDFRAWVFTVA